MHVCMHVCACVYISLQIHRVWLNHCRALNSQKCGPPMVLWPAGCSLLQTIHYCISIGFQDIVHLSGHTLAFQDINSGHALLFQDIDSGHALLFQDIDSGHALLFQDIDSGHALLFQDIDSGHTLLFQDIECPIILYACAY